MPANLELKARLHSRDAARRDAESLGAAFHGQLYQVDTYFCTQSGRMKLREINGTSAELIYYERAEAGGQRVSRFERYPVDQPALLKEILSRTNGMRGAVEKNRIVYLLGGIRIHLDDVKSLGFFLEFEIPFTESVEEAEQQLQLLVKRFGIRQEDYFSNSYIDLIIGKNGKAASKSAPGEEKKT